MGNGRKYMTWSVGKLMLRIMTFFGLVDVQLKTEKLRREVFKNV